MEQQEQFRNLLKRALSQPTGELNGQHVAEADILAFYQGRLPSEQGANVQRHLLLCAECLQVFEDARRFSALPAQGEAFASEQQRQASWAQLAERLGLPAPKPKVMSAAVGWRLALAFGVCVLLGVIAVWRWPRDGSKPELARVTAPPPAAEPAPSVRAEAIPSPPHAVKREVPHQPDAHRPYAAGSLLVLSTARTDDEAALAARRIPTDAASFSLQLKKFNPTEFDVYQVELLDEAGQVKETVKAVVGKDRLIEAVFARAALQDGAYRVRVTGIGPGGLADESFEGALKLVFQGK